jgi:hypothetical protein
LRQNFHHPVYFQFALIARIRTNWFRPGRVRSWDKVMTRICRCWSRNGVQWNRPNRCKNNRQCRRYKCHCFGKDSIRIRWC